MKKISRRSFLAAAAVSAAALALTACGGSASTASSAAASSVAASSEAASTSAAAAELTTVEAGKLTMATNATFPPYEMTTDAGTIEGIDVDTAQAIAEKLGLELQIDDMDFDAALLSVQQGKADIAMAGITVTDERMAVMSFSNSYATGIQSVIVPEGSDIASVDDLAGKKIGTQRGTTGYLYCSDDFGEDAVVAYDNGLTAVQALNNGQVDAVVIDNEPAKAYVESNPGLKILDTSYAEEDYAIGMNKSIFKFYQAFVLKDRWLQYIGGVGTTLLVTAIALAMGVLLGSVVALVRVAHDQQRPGRRNPVLGVFNAVCQVYTAVIRGTPMMVQLLIMSMVIFNNSRNFTMVGALALGINSGAYVSEIIRGGLMAVDPGQMEAGRSLGLNYITTMVVIIIPQAIRAVLPALGNEFIMLLKDTSLITVIGGKELLYAAQGIMNRTYEAMFPLFGVALIYLVLVMIFTWLLAKFERRLAQSDR